MKYSLKTKQTLSELESFHNDNDLYSAPYLSEPNTNNESKVDHIGLPPKHDFNNPLR